MAANTVTKAALPQQRLPAGLTLSPVWRAPDGTLVEGQDGARMVVDDTLRVAASLWMCPQPDCDFRWWVPGLDPGVEPDVACCPAHPLRLVLTDPSATDRDPVAGARERLTGRVRETLTRHRRRVADAARARAQAMRAEAERVARRTTADLRGHVPSAAVTTAGFTAAGVVRVEAGPWAAALAGAGLASVGAVAAYVAVYVAERLRARGADGRARVRVLARARGRARHAGFGAATVGAWTVVTAATGVDPASIRGAFMILLAAALAWAINREHWERLSTDRARLRELARLAAQEAAAKAAREAEEAARRAAQDPVAVVVDDSPEAMGRRMADEWRRISRLDTVPLGLPIARTWIVAEDTREVTAPIDGQVVRIGWEYAGECEPGALAARPGMQPPLLAARAWLADVIDNGAHDPATLSLVDRPDGRANRFVLLITDQAPLGEPVRWKGRAGVRVTSDGSLYAHRGRDMQGNDVEDCLYAPSQAGGGLVAGTTGGGKSVGNRLRILNQLVAGLFPVLFDPKQLVDYGDFIGIFPIGVTTEHRDVILASLVAERQRRERLLARKPNTDRHGRQRSGASVWDLADGPGVSHVWEEFHDLATDDVFVGRLTQHIRFQRSAAMQAWLISQGGGLADVNNSVLRMLLNQVSLTVYRTDAHQARLAGSKHPDLVAGLPRLPGVCLVESPWAPPMPVRDAFVTRDDEDGCVFDQLYGPNMEPLLTAPALPEETVAVWERTGLMDLWRLGQGPGGLERLLADAEGPSGGPPPAVAPSGGAGLDDAADVVLGIAHLSPGCTRAAVDAHPVWGSPVTGGKVPAASTVTRAAKRLETDGLLTRVDGWRVTDKGRAKAEAAAAVITDAGAPAAPPSGPPAAGAGPVSEAAVERVVERQMEAAQAAVDRLGDGR